MVLKAGDPLPAEQPHPQDWWATDVVWLPQQQISVSAEAEKKFHVSLEKILKAFSVDLHGFSVVFAENLGHLKRLQYLNLALNNIEVIENLEGHQT